MRRWLAPYIFLILQICASSAVAQDAEAPFGLTWGSSIDQVKSMGIELKPQEKGSFGDSYLASKLPKAISDQEVTFLSFGNDNKLWRIAAISTPFENDPYGAKGQERYDELSGVLSEKYGKGKSVKRLGESIYSDPKYFVAGIRGGESQCFTDFDSANLSVQLGLFASDSSTLRWRIIYENKRLRALFEQDQKTHEKNSL
jgi:hypothetical protein